MKWFYNMKIGKKLIASFVVVACFAGIIGIFGATTLLSIDSDYSEMYDTKTVPLAHLGTVGMMFQENRAYIVRITVTEDVKKIDTAYSAVKANDEIISSELSSIGESSTTAEDKAALNELTSGLNEYNKARDEVVQFAYANANNSPEAKAKLDEANVIATKVTETIRNIYSEQIEDSLQLSEGLTNQSFQSTIILIVVAVFAMIIAILLGMFITRNISKPVTNLVGKANQIADGNLNITMEIDSKDEIGQLASAFSRMVDTLNEVISNIKNASDQVDSGAKQMSESSILLSQGATEQASSMEQLTASLEEVSTKINSNADNSIEANRLAQQSKDSAMQGNDRMKAMLDAMDDINTSSASISKIIKVIDEIAFQTNILALNAAVEAARAGQHGKGFAVVAEEVRNLAARSANAAKETTEMIEGSIRKVDDGMKIANDTAGALNSIVQEITKVTELVGNISEASTEQAAGIAQINQGLIQVSQVIQSNSATSEESAAASEELTGQANLMKEQVHRFKLRESQGSYYKPTMLKSNSTLDEVFAEAAADMQSISNREKGFGKY